MLKGIFTKKIVLISAISFSLFLMCLIPTKEINFNNQELSYSENNLKKSVIYLMDSNNYLSRTSVVSSNENIEKKAKELLEILIKDGKGESKIPSGFKDRKSVV